MEDDDEEEEGEAEVEESCSREVLYSYCRPMDEAGKLGGESKAPVVENKKKRSFSGMRDPDAEVIALSPKALLATNRFVCEICNKGFQRDQNLQLHRRGHNLPWKLRQRTSKDIRKRVYVCPEPTCVHHDPARALGDLTGIKKHFCRKHGEKKHRCDRCSKKYAVLSDLKAHVKTCGTREYRCDCGTLFSRKDSFITHRAFCDALAQERTRSDPAGELNVHILRPPGTSSSSPLPPPPLTPPTDVLSPAPSVGSSELQGNRSAAHFHSLTGSSVEVGVAPCSDGGVSEQCGSFCVVGSPDISQSFNPPPCYPTLFRPISDSASLTLSPSLYGVLSSFPGAPLNPRQHYMPNSPPVLSATALLQKAAQMGTTTSNPSVLHVFSRPAPPPPTSDISAMAAASVSTASKWNNVPSPFDESIFRQSPLFSGKGDYGTATLDFLGVRMEGSGGGFLSSINGASDLSGIGAWDDDSPERKPSIL